MALFINKKEVWQLTSFIYVFKWYLYSNLLDLKKKKVKANAPLKITNSIKITNKHIFWLYSYNNVSSLIKNKPENLGQALNEIHELYADRYRDNF